MEAAHQHGFRVILFTIALGFSPPLTRSTLISGNIKLEIPGQERS